MKPLLALLVLLPCASQPLAGQSTPGDSTEYVYLGFGWHPGLSADITATVFRREQADGQPQDSSSTSLVYRMRVEDAGKDLLRIAYDRFRLPGATEDDVASAMLSSMQPGYLVNTEGLFVGLESPDSVRARLIEFVEMTAGSDSTARAALESMLSPELIESQSIQEWSMLVGQWVDAEVAGGDMYEEESIESFPIVPGASVRMTHVYRVEYPVPCKASDDSPDCVALHVRSRPDPDEVAAVMRSFLERLMSIAGHEGTAYVSNIDIVTTGSLITEPGTLKPHRMEVIKDVHGMVTQGEKIQPFSRYEARTLEFDYSGSKR